MFLVVRMHERKSSLAGRCGTPTLQVRSSAKPCSNVFTGAASGMRFLCCLCWFPHSAGIAIFSCPGPACLSPSHGFRGFLIGLACEIRSAAGALLPLVTTNVQHCTRLSHCWPISALRSLGLCPLCIRYCACPDIRIGSCGRPISQLLCCRSILRVSEPMCWFFSFCRVPSRRMGFFFGSMCFTDRRARNPRVRAYDHAVCGVCSIAVFLLWFLVHRLSALPHEF